MSIFREWRLFGTAVCGLVLGLALLNPGETAAEEPPAIGDGAQRALPAGPRGDAVRLGQRLVSDTARELPQFVGNGLTCSNCHLAGGTVSHASPWVGLWGVFPEYRSRSAKVISLEERINDCMRRSMNGHALAYDSPQMAAILSYIQWLSEGSVTGVPPAGRGFGPIDTSLKPDAVRGQSVYVQRCAVCHATNGAGVADAKGSYAFPPLWGPASFNVGAGMARTYTAAAFILHNMPQGQVGVLSAQDAVDVAQFVTHQARPDFPERANDWPLGDAPSDARTH